ncbi:hypothetical protein KRR38_22170 [Novosphingobium sp. G106]|uniref:hypothetical protein n=1 Tax=Novosphingobium sp. G106 TaxID=2849500 RepID=UPI001C2CFF37|nr:hypothetical protein [Novosphingobium sp. G106]MBV1690314.1 hypothetical protein [Novosphingobium sp. G106]
MTTPGDQLAAGKRLAAIAGGRGVAQDTPKDSAAGESRGAAPKVVKPRHGEIGLEDDIHEHESERLNPGDSGGNETGASGDRPKDPSNSA